MINQTDVRDWRDQAKITLEKVQVLCTKAQVLLGYTNNLLITTLPNKVEYLDMLIKSFKEQFVHCRNVTDIIRTEYANLSFNGKAYFQLESAVKSLDDVLVKLRRIEVNPLVLEDESKEKSLIDFISLDFIELAKRNISAYKSNHEAVDTLMRVKLATFLSAFGSTSIKQNDKLQKQYDEEVIPIKLAISSQDSMINTILKENASLEHELISILEMLTNHYDQCNQAVELFHESTEKNLNVLYSDTLELVDVLKELNTICDIIFNNEARSNKFVHFKFKNLDLFTTNIEGQLNHLRNYKTGEIIELLAIVDNVVEYFNTTTNINGYLENIKQLTYHYSNFIDIYKDEYLNELYYEKYIYPRKFLGKLTTFLNNELGELQKDEINRRKIWLEKFGNFIPKELKLPGNSDYPLIVEVITQGLEQIDVVESEEEKGLLDLLRERQKAKSMQRTETLKINR